MIYKVLMKTMPKIWMFPNQIHIMKMKIEIVEVLKSRSLPLDDSNLDLGTLSVGRKRGVETMNLYLYGWWKTKVIETLPLKGYL